MSAHPPADAWNQRYASGDVYGTAPNDFLRDVVGVLAPQSRVLSLAEGQGRNAVFLAERGHTVTAVDISRTGLERVRALADARNVTARIETIEADLGAYEPAGPFDAVIAVFAHLPSAVRRVAYRRAARSLVPHGLFVLESYRPEQVSHGTGGPRDRDLLPTLDELREDLTEGDLRFDFIVARAVERIVVEGTLHTGLAATNQLLARRAG